MESSLTALEVSFDDLSISFEREDSPNKPIDKRKTRRNNQNQEKTKISPYQRKTQLQNLL